LAYCRIRRPAVNHKQWKPDVFIDENRETSQRRAEFKRSFPPLWKSHKDRMGRVFMFDVSRLELNNDQYGSGAQGMCLGQVMSAEKHLYPFS